MRRMRGERRTAAGTMAVSNGLSIAEWAGPQGQAPGCLDSHHIRQRVRRLKAVASKAHSAATLAMPRKRNLRAPCCSLDAEDRFDQVHSSRIRSLASLPWTSRPGAYAALRWDLLPPSVTSVRRADPEAQGRVSGGPGGPIRIKSGAVRLKGNAAMSLGR